MKMLVWWIFSSATIALVAARHDKNHHNVQEKIVTPGFGIGPVIPWCHWDCHNHPANGPEYTLEITNNAKDKLLSIYSEFTKIALVKDYAHNLAAIYNGSSGEVAVSDLKNQCHYHVERTPVHSWTVSASSWAAHFAKLHSLIPLYKEAKRQHIIECAPDEHTPVFAAIAKGYVSLGSFLPPKETQYMLVQLAEHLQGPLGALYKNSSHFKITNNLEWFLKVNLAIANLLETGKVGKNVEKANVDIKLVFGERSAFEGLLNLFIKLGRHCDIFRVVLPYLSEERLFELLLRLTGGSDKGIDGLIHVITKIVLFLHGRADLNDVISTIINYKPDGADVRLHTLIEKYLKVIEAQQSYHHAPPQFQIFIRFLKALNDNNLILNGVNISDIIKLLSTRNPAEIIPNIIKILSHFCPSRGIPQFFKFIIGVLNGTHDARILTRLIPGLNLAHFNASGNILRQILHGQNWTQILHQGASALSHIPIFGQIIKGIESAFPGANITHYLNPVTIIHEIQHTIGHSIEQIVSGIGHGFETIFGGGNSSNSGGGLFGGLTQIFGGGGGESGSGNGQADGGGHVNGGGSASGGFSFG